MTIEEAQEIIKDARSYESDLPLYDAACYLLRRNFRAFDAGYLACEIDYDLRDDFNEDERKIIKEFHLTTP